MIKRKPPTKRRDKPLNQQITEVLIGQHLQSAHYDATYQPFILEANIGSTFLTLDWPDTLKLLQIGNSNDWMRSRLEQHPKQSKQTSFSVLMGLVDVVSELGQRGFFSEVNIHRLEQADKEEDIRTHYESLLKKERELHEKQIRQVQEQFEQLQGSSGKNQENEFRERLLALESETEQRIQEAVKKQVKKEQRRMQNDYEENLAQLRKDADDMINDIQQSNQRQYEILLKDRLSQCEQQIASLQRDLKLAQRDKKRSFKQLNTIRKQTKKDLREKLKPIIKPEKRGELRSILDSMNFFNSSVSAQILLQTHSENLDSSSDTSLHSPSHPSFLPTFPDPSVISTNLPPQKSVLSSTGLDRRPFSELMMESAKQKGWREIHLNGDSEDDTFENDSYIQRIKQVNQGRVPSQPPPPATAVQPPSPPRSEKTTEQQPTIQTQRDDNERIRSLIGDSTKDLAIDVDAMDDAFLAKLRSQLSLFTKKTLVETDTTVAAGLGIRREEVSVSAERIDEERRSVRNRSPKHQSDERIEDFSSASPPIGGGPEGLFPAPTTAMDLRPVGPVSQSIEYSQPQTQPPFSTTLDGPYMSQSANYGPASLPFPVYTASAPIGEKNGQQQSRGRQTEPMRQTHFGEGWGQSLEPAQHPHIRTDVTSTERLSEQAKQLQETLLEKQKRMEGARRERENRLKELERVVNEEMGSDTNKSATHPSMEKDGTPKRRKSRPRYDIDSDDSDSSSSALRHNKHRSRQRHNRRASRPPRSRSRQTRRQSESPGSSESEKQWHNQTDETTFDLAGMKATVDAIVKENRNEKDERIRGKGPGYHAHPTVNDSSSEDERRPQQQTVTHQPHRREQISPKPTEESEAHSRRNTQSEKPKTPQSQAPASNVPSPDTKSRHSVQTYSDDFSSTSSSHQSRKSHPQSSRSERTVHSGLTPAQSIHSPTPTPAAVSIQESANKPLVQESSQSEDDWPADTNNTASPKQTSPRIQPKPIPARPQNGLDSSRDFVEDSSGGDEYGPRFAPVTKTNSKATAKQAKPPINLGATFSSTYSLGGFDSATSDTESFSRPF
ncbi:hypothetical protein BLNAU_7935 [Blattamonas nauphoetae]|uniref:Uncharacterized protein n=1 Tax=Blattamonas nauphoetae TaxID=2049346 RepID=A0ABQ9Y059_9EUKA|nr:hypothetical protein BLNAU_7935 [Blattamonas nauphoetae]